MKYLILSLLFFPAVSQAHCPHKVQSAGQEYCVEVTWDYGDRKVQDQFEPIEVLSPYLVSMGEIPQRWVYSKAYITAWKKKDSSQALVEIPSFRVFPYMHMINGHHHSASYEFGFDPASQVYTFDKVAFRHMRGCWSLRWTTALEDSMGTSNLLGSLTDFTNLNDKQVEEQVRFCRDMGVSK